MFRVLWGRINKKILASAQFVCKARSPMFLVRHFVTIVLLDHTMIGHRGVRANHVAKDDITLRSQLSASHFVRRVYLASTAI
jgi:hypothetical protein